MIRVKFLIWSGKNRLVAFDNTTAAKRILDNILSEDAILAISIMDINGTILASKSKQSFREKFGSTRDGEKYGGSLAVASLVWSMNWKISLMKSKQ